MFLIIICPLLTKTQLYWVLDLESFRNNTELAASDTCAVLNR